MFIPHIAEGDVLLAQGGVLFLMTCADSARSFYNPA
jgi:hypothetical protein